MPTNERPKYNYIKSIYNAKKRIRIMYKINCNVFSRIKRLFSELVIPIRINIIIKELTLKDCCIIINLSSIDLFI